MQTGLIHGEQRLLFNSDRWHRSTVADDLRYRTKRCLDVSVSTCLLILLLPLMLVIAALIKIESRGPIVFVQQRVGCRRRRSGGKVAWESTLFPFYKFRSMHHGLDQSVQEERIRRYVQGIRSEVPKGVNDCRITRIGRIIRKTSLDELPQLFNVLRGDMSLVGPRPAPPYEVANYAAHHYERLTALPGLTGLWQVSGRALTSFDEQIALDVRYVRHQSLWLDLKILLLTIPAVLTGRGAG